MGVILAKKPSESEQKNWYKDKYQHIFVQRNILALTTLVALLVALGSVVTVMQLAPLKTLEPYMINVDERTGLVQNVKSMTYKDITDNEAVNNYFLVKYIRAVETYDISDLRANYNVVRVMSAPGVYQEFVSEKRPSNPESPSAILKNLGKRKVEITSLTYFSSPQMKRIDKGIQTASVRVTLSDQIAGNPVPVNYYKLITISFQYTNLNLTQRERHINPLGFRVISYRVDEEIKQ